MINILLHFYKNPYIFFNTGQEDTLAERFLIVKKSYIFCLLSSFSILFLLVIFIEMPLNEIYDISILKNLTGNRKAFREANTPWVGFFKIGILGPFIEECLFRLALITKSPFFRLIIFVILADYFSAGLLYNELPLIWYYGILISVFVIIILANSISNQEVLVSTGSQNYNYLCYALTLAFAAAHINNFAPLNWSFIYLYPFFVLPQFVYGVVFSYLAIRYNSILLPFILHASINCTAEIYRLVLQFC
ncbi:type II CAAX prenyl endopeptidase Rce1 family protein [Dyadobacter sp. 3J3]|uniref:CPBP family glutamic-type intramembrane protease n=1 Tax=Dyadobacter sp. 3J3 TaxID=2606600 RepID=UPI00135AAF9D